MEKPAAFSVLNGLRQLDDAIFYAIVGFIDVISIMSLAQ
jgi:hypothetical protein